jgi:uncharacterized protein (TIGR02757 family)
MRREALHEALEQLRARTNHARRIERDPVELPHRFSDPRDIEVSALLSACLAYGRADLFKPKLEELHARLGPSPAKTVEALDVAGAVRITRGFVYRFNVATDLAVLLLGMGQALRAHGSLEALFCAGLGEGGDLRQALSAFTRALRQVPMAPLRRGLGPERGLHHLLPSPLGPGAAKRLNLYLRWMVRGPDAVDFGIWRKVPAGALMIPLDTHIARLSKHLGLTRRRDLGWRTANEITSALRAVDPADPVKYDFALCHHGMSGACPLRPRREDCARCPLAPVCHTGRRRLSRAAGRRSAAAG